MAIAILPLLATAAKAAAAAAAAAGTSSLIQRMIGESANVSSCFSGNGEYASNVVAQQARNVSYIEAQLTRFQSDGPEARRFLALAQPLLAWCGQRNHPSNDRSPLDSAISPLLSEERTRITATVGLQEEQARLSAEQARALWESEAGILDAQNLREQQQFEQVLALEREKIRTLPDFQSAFGPLTSFLGGGSIPAGVSVQTASEETEQPSATPVLILAGLGVAAFFFFKGR